MSLKIVRTVSTLIVKPTKFCNAQCDYCAAPPEANGAPKWTQEQFARVFDAIEPALTPFADVIFHGGEPMLMGPGFYREAYAYARRRMPGVRFAMQSNILGYSDARWRDVVADVFAGRLSTSFDPDMEHRFYKGSTSLYARIFKERLDAVLASGVRPMVLGTYTEETAGRAMEMYEYALAKGDAAPDLRFNYRFPAGRDAGRGELISPETYGAMLLGLWERWRVDLPRFGITPVDQMFRKVVGLEADRCPWTNACGGRFLAVEPNGDVYNCGDFADLQDRAYMFGNAFEDGAETLLASPAARAMRRRRVDLPASCKACRHFGECEGGCTRDSVIYGRGLGGKFYYCRSWIMVFDRIKECVRKGLVDGLLEQHGLDPAAVRARVGEFDSDGAAMGMAG